MSSGYPGGYGRSRDPALHPTVLVVDDETVLVDVVCELLNDEGIDAGRCPAGPRAYDTIRALQPRVVILDLQMPGIDGITLFEQLRADPLTRSTAVIFFTANGHLLRARLPQFQAMGAELVTKPFDLAALMAAVQRALA